MSAWWDSDHKLCLLTPQEYSDLPDGTLLECIDGEQLIKGQGHVDDDTRGGHLAWGVIGEHPLRLKLLLIQGLKHD